MEPYRASLNNDVNLGSAFVVYCNDVAAATLAQTGTPGLLLGSFFLGQISDTTTQPSDRFGAASPVLTAYEQAAYLAMRFGRPPAPEYNSLEKLYADIHAVLWRLVLSTSDFRFGPPGAAVDWMTLANNNAFSFDYSQWRF